MKHAISRCLGAASQSLYTARIWHLNPHFDHPGLDPKIMSEKLCPIFGFGSNYVRFGHFGYNIMSEKIWYECKIHNNSSRMCVDVRGRAWDVRGCARMCRFYAGCAPCFSSFRAQTWFLRACAENSRARWREYAFCGHFGCFLKTWQASQIIKKLPKTVIRERSYANITASKRK